MTEDELKTNAISLVNQIYERQYFIPIWEWVLQDKGVTNDNFHNRELSRDVIINVANSFWMMLPDAREIHRAPFYQLCDICEQMFED